ncbi:hypothetical protein HME9304_03150 [Flagellimonas maritima]|uniref:Uncharacterized protein n=1 Tax=Flagellimonas maritima TaxID=1383885 RepID=A0A2Z4LXL5_9FLAO|nr:hypothetical protein HME9304_03150 [Allomuricauda aurantiaca]
MVLNINIDFSFNSVSIYIKFKNIVPNDDFPILSIATTFKMLELIIFMNFTILERDRLLGHLKTDNRLGQNSLINSPIKVVSNIEYL